jgi:hypothetical protein
MMDEFGRSVQLLAGLAGAVIGVAIGTWFGDGGRPVADRIERFDQGLALLADGFQL